MSGIILYKSKYGSTKTYATWLAEETGFEMVETDQARIADVCQHDVILLGGGIYASSIAGLSFLKKHWSKLKGKRCWYSCAAHRPTTRRPSTRLSQPT